MPKFGKSSKARLDSCHPKLQKVFNEVIKHVDCKILEGYRNAEVQNHYYDTGRSKLKFPQGNHNRMPSKAVDVVPYPVQWGSLSGEKRIRELCRLYMFVGYVLATADRLGIKLRVGADWDGDWELNDQSFHDVPHFELVGD